MSAHFKIRIALIGLLIAGALGGCSDNATGPATGTMRIRMTDAPALFDHINLVVTQISVHPGTAADSDSVAGWQVVRTSPANIDLVALRNGATAQLVVATLGAGTYSMIRLKLGAGSTITDGGVTYPLVVPSGLQSGLKIHGPFTVPDGGTTDIIIDFDAARSVHQNGTGVYILNPVVRALPTSIAGAITGRVQPDSLPTTVFAIQASDTVTSTIAALDGHFTVSALTAGTYSLAFHPETAYRDTTITGVVVTAGNITAVGDVQLTPQ